MSKLSIVEDVAVRPKGLNEFGEVCDGYIAVRGPLKEGWRMACLWHHDAESSVIYLFEDDRSLDPSEQALQLKLGYCKMDVVDSSMVIDQPVSTWGLRITEIDSLAQCGKEMGHSGVWVVLDWTRKGLAGLMMRRWNE